MANIGRRVVEASSKFARSLGSTLDSLGAQLEVAKHTDRLVPSTRFVAVDNTSPTVSEYASFVAPSASVIGNVSVGEKSSIWYGATIRGDTSSISIGENTNIGDRALVKIQNDTATSIGNNVTVGPAAIINSATIHNDIIIGAAAQILDGSVVESNTIIAPGSVVMSGMTVSAGQLWAGVPAAPVRKLTPEEMEGIVAGAGETSELAVKHAVECAKDYKQLAIDEELYEDERIRDLDYFPRPKEGEADPEDILGQGAPGRIFDSTLTHPERAIEEMNKEAAKATEGK
mmetsp:Transcript_33610/g.41164  ORF Transcript_33610/g.41164 Transcript_33610/m.41164 type:complete len:287 (+) Transcript_33610:92-952(+)|eukprot:CAMPEP_0172495190 /NCGR_PEP_ID=MMETSP1066-20121228/64214_1 /TAXON_ID=671091 /ORGANISM="Coscinodiscus wailesii, Strain CCMP2513" /LENGTH=286 /DNA_ID=CAMNT_0013266703 /DNA_START=89 /DNA_END=949 /DNA_ORIENTATION=+